MSKGEGRTDPSAERSRYGARIYWQETVERPPVQVLGGDLRADVAIVGGGFTGLWTAVYLKRADPQLEVVVLEAEQVAFGATGRNTGNAITKLDRGLAHLESRLGSERARILFNAVATAVDEIGRVCEEVEIDCDYRKTGWLNVATNPGQERRLRVDFEAGERIGIEGLRLLSRRRDPRSCELPDLSRRALQPGVRRGKPDAARRGARSPCQGARGSGLRGQRGLRVGAGDPRRRARDRTRPRDRAADRDRHQRLAAAMCAPRGHAGLLLHRRDTSPCPRRSGRPWAGRVSRRFSTSATTSTTPGAPRTDASCGEEPTHSTTSAPRSRPGSTVTAPPRTGFGARFTRPFPNSGRSGSPTPGEGPWRSRPASIRALARWWGDVSTTAWAIAAMAWPSQTSAGGILRDLVLHRDTEETNLPLVGDTAYRMPNEPLRWFGARVTRSSMRKQDRSLDRGRGVEQSTRDPFPLRALDGLSGHGKKPR